MSVKKTLVADVMTTRPPVLTVDASLEEADLALRAALITGLPVVDSDGALVGVVTDANLVTYRFVHLRHHPVEATRPGGVSGEVSLVPVEPGR
jgi:predicted transcriptional regulator